MTARWRWTSTEAAAAANSALAAAAAVTMAAAAAKAAGALSDDGICKISAVLMKYQKLLGISVGQTMINEPKTKTKNSKHTTFPLLCWEFQRETIHFCVHLTSFKYELRYYQLTAFSKGPFSF